MRGRSARAAFAVIAAAVSIAGSFGVVAAAGPNELSNGRVSQTNGTTSTVFTFSVDYRSERDFAASTVVAVVAGRAVTLRMASGTASAGRFSGTSTLPAGRWPVDFQAEASQGPNPSLAGPTVVVTAPAATPPPSTPAPTPKPPPPPTPPPATTAPATTPPAPRASTPAATPQPASSTAAATPELRSAGATSSPTAAASAASSSGAPSPTSGIIGGTDVGGRSRAGDDNAAGMWLGLGALSVAGLSLGAVVIARRRRPPEEAAEPAGEPIPLMTEARPSLSAGSHGVEDPILAAMGLGTTSQPDPNAPITRSIHFGPGERPTHPKPRTH